MMEGCRAGQKYQKMQKLLDFEVEKYIKMKSF